MTWGKIKLSVMCENWEKVETFFKKLKLDYCGQGLAGGTFEALQCLIKRNNIRTTLTGQEKAKVLEACDYRCAFCGSKSKRLEFDHVVRHSESFGGAPQVQALCASCHLLKTNAESRNMDGCIFGSSLSKSAWDQYVESERLPALVLKHKEVASNTHYRVADVIRCRRRALQLSAHRIPIFSALDNVEVSLHEWRQDSERFH